MSSSPAPEVDPRRVRIGLVLLTLVLLVAIVLAIMVESSLARLIMGGIIVFTLARSYLLVRSVRRGA